MKRSFLNSFVIISVLISLILTGLQVRPAYAQGSGMEIVPLTLPAGWTSGHLYGIWGSSASDVYAVGYGDNGSATVPLLYYNNGSGWGGSDLPIPAGWRSGYLFNVWGAGANDVYAVGSGNAGSDSNGSILLPLIYHKDASGWNLSSPPLPAGWRSGYLYSIWGSSASDVYAVGYGYDANKVLLPLAYYNNGSGWSDAGVSAPGNWSSVNLRGVWGSSANDIYAAGFGNNGSTTLPLIYHQNGGSWGASNLSVPNDNGYLYGIWGSSATDVYAAGYGNKGSDTLPLLYHNNGSSWSEAGLSVPSGWRTGYLYSVWGSGANDVYAVGSGNMGSALLPLLYHNNGTGWSESSPVLPSGWSFGYLQGVWGSTDNDVYAVGTGNNGSANLPLIYHSSQVGPDLFEPGDVTQLTATTGTTSGSVKLSWTAPADDYNDPNSGSVATYLVKYSLTPFTSWTDGKAVTTGQPVPTAPGTTQTMTVSGLNPNTLYYFAVRAQDERYNLSKNYVTVSATSSGILNSSWYIYGIGSFSFGEGSDIPVPADYNGDGRTDIAVFRASNSTWYISGIGNFLYGTVGDIPVPADYNGDGRTDIAIFRPSTSTWYIYGVGNFLYGTVGDIPVVADYNGDGKADIAVFRPSTSTWYIYGLGDFLYGTVGDIPVIADYNGDHKADIAVFRPSDGNWYIYGVGNFLFGSAGDVPVVADYNRDGKADIAVFRP